ncbi:hypothetical protein B0I35DRAFT_189720 [Stachybotrys elegans]|uniref:HNH domain-containing protein n=1 Tax=Stachybotrys elegans TaxID=80388 RepID=A0A8K0SZD1_9HYPO|nr:hypothetical protein B0I35DRAFT_189720 [Stachybotrys elegans]
MEDNPNYALFRDCLSTTIIRAASDTPRPKRRRRTKQPASAAAPASAPEPAPATTPARPPDPARDAEELADFVDYLASEIFESLPEDLQNLDYRLWRESEDLQSRFSLPLTPDSLSLLNLPPSVPETLTTYNLTTPDASTEAFLVPILTAYIEPLIAPPPATAATRAEACELCDRSWIPLSYHHLIPRFVHDKAVKRGWHRKEDLQNVAWLCGACHRFVHHFKGHEELARSYYTVDLLLEEEEVRKFAAWVGKLRWKRR